MGSIAKQFSSKRRKVGGDGGDGASKGDGTKPTFDGFATRTIHAGKLFFLNKHPTVTRELTFSYDHGRSNAMRDDWGSGNAHIPDLELRL